MGMSLFCDRRRRAYGRAFLCMSVFSSALLSACAGQRIRPPPLASQAELTAKGKASVVFATQISNAVHTPSCERSSVTLVKIENPGLKPIDIWWVYVPKQPTNTPVYFAELDPGTYALAQIYCINTGSHSVTHQYKTQSTPFASFEVKAGEVVDLGTVHVNMFDNDSTILTAGKNLVPTVFVYDKAEHYRTKALPQSLRGDAKLRLMKSHFPVDAAGASKACEEQRAFRSTHGAIGSAFVALKLQFDAPICEFVTTATN